MFIFFKRSLLPLKCFKLKLLLVLLIVVQSIFVFGQSTKTNDLLLPFKKDSLWGLSKPDKQIIVAPQYSYINYEHPYYFAGSNKENRIDVFDLKGNKLDTCQIYIAMDSVSFILFKRTALPFTAQVDWVNPMNRSDFSNQSLMRIMDSNFLIFKLNSNKTVLVTEGVVRQVSFKTSTENIPAKNVFKAVIDLKGKAGVFDLIENKYIINPKYAHIKFIPPSTIVAFNDSNDILVTNIFGEKIKANKNYILACYIEPLSGRYIVEQKMEPDDITRVHTSRQYHYEYRDRKNNIIIPFHNNWVFDTHHTPPDYIKKTWDTTKGILARHELYDLNGKKTNNDIGLMEQLQCKHVYEIRRINREKRKDELIGFYNTQLKKYIWESVDSINDKNGYSTSYSSGLPIIKTKNKVYILDDKGNNLNDFLKKNTAITKDINDGKFEKIVSGDVSENRFAHFYLLGNTKRGNSFFVFDENFKFHPDISDINSVYPGTTMACKVKGKWGIYDAQLKEIIPPVYEQLIQDSKHYILKKDSLYYYFESTNLRLTRITKYKNSSDYKVNDLWMVAVENNKKSNSTLRKENDSTSFLLIDSNDNIKYQLNRASYGREYRLTANGQLLEYSYHYQLPTVLIDFITKKEKVLPYSIDKITENNDAPAVTIVVKKEGQYGLASAIDFTLLDNFHVENEGYFSYSTSFENAEGKRKEVVYIEKIGKRIVPDNPMDFMNNNEPNERTILGIVSYDGEKYWND